MNVATNANKWAIIPNSAKQEQQGTSGRYSQQQQQRVQSVQNVQRQRGWDSSTTEDEEDIQVLKVSEVNVSENKPFVLKGKLNEKEFRAIIDTGSPVTIFTKKHVDVLLGKNYPIRELEENEKYVDYNQQQIQFVGQTAARLQCGPKKMQKARLLVAQDGTKSIVGRDWIRALGLKIKPEGETDSKSVVNIVNKGQDDKLYKEFFELFNREGRVKDYRITAEFNNNFKPIQQKGRRIPLQLQDTVKKEIDELIKNGHIEKVSEIKDDVFIQPTVITVKRDKSIKIALDARAMNNEIKKDKYQMPNLEDLMNTIAESIKGANKGKVWFTSVDLKYAYGQVPLDDKLSEQCNFAIIGGKASGIYRFKTGFYGLTVMPTEFQRIIEEILINNPNVFIFIDDILIVTKGSKEQHEQEVKQILKKLDEKKLEIKMG